jgi:hypothetical protein
MKTDINLTWRSMILMLLGLAFSSNGFNAAETRTQATAVGVNSVQILNGAWKLAMDPENRGRQENWCNQVQPGAKEAAVPGVIQQVFPGSHGVAWYWHTFHPRAGQAPDDRALLRFGAVDYFAEVWVNGKLAGSSEGGEAPFELDITDALLKEADNLLAVRVVNPTDTPIDGFLLSQTPHRNKTAPPRCGAMFNSGGILYPVELRRVPPIYIADTFVRPNPKTGDIDVTVSVRNSGSELKKVTIGLSVSPGGGGDVLLSVDRQADIPAGFSEHALTMHISQPRLWDLDDPYLYRVDATVVFDAHRAHRQSVPCGFRDFRIVDGYFHLNGKRLFLKSTHTGNAMPIGQTVVATGDFGRRDMIYAKASGFNTVRFIAGVAYPEQLDLCDQLGLMVYEECLAAWELGDSPKMGERFDRNTSAMIRRDRNHPSVAIWGLLNETQDGPVFRQAVGFLPKLRQLDPTRLVLLGSGRWDAQHKIGSASNPGTDDWQPVWGVEGANAEKASLGAGGYVSKAGDAHYYPGTPHTPLTDLFIRQLGGEDKPVFLSEYGIGSQMNVISEWKHFEQAGARSDLEDAVVLREQSEAFAADWKRLGFDNVYAFPEDMLRESQRLHARQRTIGFNDVRSNPRLCGYNLTGMLDHAITGEGLWTYWREWKPSVFDAVADGWSPLRWCLFADPLHGYAGRTVTVDAVLATEDALAPGDYPVRFRVLGPLGPVWEKEAVLKIPPSPALAIPAIRETFELKGPAGAYVFAANMERGGSPTGGRLSFFVSDPACLPSLKGEAVLWGVDKKAEQWLAARGLVCHPLTSDIVSDSSAVVLVGKPADVETNTKLWKSLTARMTGGASVVFLSAQVFQNGKAAMNWLPLKQKGTCRSFNDWLYHKECVAKRHPVFDGLQGPGVMDWDYYGPVIPHEIFEGQETPSETIAAAFATGNSQYPRGYGSSLLIASYNSGKGRFILSTPYVLENLDTHPAADRLLLNLVRFAQGFAL